MVAQKVSALDVEAGLYVLRYAAGARRGATPVITVAVPARWSQSIQIVAEPGAQPGELAEPGACLVICAREPGQLEATSRARTAAGSIEAELKLERLSAPSLPRPRAFAGPSRDETIPTVARRNGPSAGAITLLAHVARRGDVNAGAGEWIGGPDMPLPIEGIELQGSGGQVPDLEYQVLSGLRQQRWSAWVRAGEFAGTRGRSLPVLGVRLRSNEPGLEFHAEALFLGSAVSSKSGQEIELLGVSGREPLVGLALRVEPPRGGLSRAAPAGAKSRPSSDRVRVFRASTG